MKKFVTFSIIWMLLAGCSDRELTTGGNIDGVPAESSFLSVSIVSAGTRADSDYEEGGGTYRNGTKDENAVTSVLFLFFGEDGKQVESVYDSDKGYLSYYLWEYTDNDTQNPNHGETVEKQLSKTIDMRFPRKYDKVVKPTQVFTVVNPTDNWETELVGKTLGELQKIVSDYETNRQSKGTFVMTTSVYLDKNDKVVCTTAIEDNNFQSTAELAEQPANILTIYVERILARIDLKIGIENAITLGEGDEAYKIYDTGVDFPNGTVTGEDQNIYVRFLGWNVFDTPNMSRLTKKIKADWTVSEPLGTGIPWSIYQYYRSFWAVNPPANTPGFEYKRGAFMSHEDDEEDDDDSHGKDAYDEWSVDANPIYVDDYSIAYFQENAAPADDDSVETTEDASYDDEHPYVPGAPVQPSKVILAAQLVDAKGKTYDLAKWGGEYFTWENLKSVICSKLDLYYLSGTQLDDNKNTEKIYLPINPKHLRYEPNEGSNTVSVVLTKDAADLVWYKGTDETDIALFEGDVNAYINKEIGENSVRVWENGYTYFYFTIQHLGTEGSAGYYGVVRNHIYDATVTKVSGLGIPVNDIRKIIVPAPDPETGVLAAQVKILSWRLVSQQYELNW